MDVLVLMQVAEFAFVNYYITCAILPPETSVHGLN